MMSQAVRAVLTVSLLLPASVAIAGPSDGDLGFSAEGQGNSVGVTQGVIHGGLFVSLVGASAVSGENWVTTLDSHGEAADALPVYHGALR